MQRQTGATTLEELVDAVMTASRVMVAVAARSVAAVDDDVTLPQYRALVVLAQRGGLRPADLAHLLAVNRSTASRMCERLVGKGLVERDRSDADRREVALTLTERGRALVDDVTRRRREELRTLVTAMSADARDGLVTALRAFADTAGEPGEPDWAVVL